MQPESRPAQAAVGYEFSIERASTYLHVVGAGEHTAENMRRFLVDAYRAAVEHSCDSLLLEANFDARSLDLASIYSVVAERSFDGSQLKSIAYVDRNLEHSAELAEFAVLAATRLGVNVRLFGNLEDAKRWLQDDSR